MARQTIEARVQLGLAWLDQHGGPGWRTRAEAPPVDCEVDWACPLGIAFGSMGDVVGDHPSARLTVQEARRLGFMPEGSSSNWAALTAAWLAADPLLPR